ncbi:MAG: type II toxin-antitoxin system PemK/MazF family toxin [Thermodesulfovibrionales bacterium]|nr:type II toxin-antitoxin system PemK/MazF family toxin [Thermodesulfovibrionales bacterium]
MNYPRRGEIYFLDFSPSKRREIKGPHPALVIQNDIGNKVSSLTIVAAITSNLKVADLPVGVLINPEESGLHHASVVHLGQIYSIDKERLETFVGMLSDHKMKEVNRAIEISFGLREFWE